MTPFQTDSARIPNGFRPCLYKTLRYWTLRHATPQWSPLLDRAKSGLWSCAVGELQDHQHSVTREKMMIGATQ